MESNGPLSIQRRLGPSGLSLHYANIVQQIDSIVSVSPFRHLVQNCEILVTVFPLSNANALWCLLCNIPCARKVINAEQK